MSEQWAITRLIISLKNLVGTLKTYDFFVLRQTLNTFSVNNYRFLQGI